MSTAADSGSSPSGNDWVPGWAPWVTLAAVLLLGFAGGLGLLPFDVRLAGAGQAEAPAAAEAAAANVKPSAAANARPASATPAPAGSADAAGGMITVAHVLIAYKGAKGADASVMRSKEAARTEAERVLALVKGGEVFAKAAFEHSDDASNKDKGGNLPPFSHDKMVKPFSEAAFKLAVGEVSGVVETPFGFHVIKRKQ